MNIFVDFILRYLSLVLASITSTIFVAIIGWILVKHMVNKAMQSKEVQELRECFDALKKEIERLKITIEKNHAT